MPARSRPRYRNGKRTTQITGLALAVAAVLVILLIPSYESASTDSSGQQTTTMVTALAANGPRILIIVAIPVILAAIPLALRGRVWQPVSVVCTILFCAFTAVAFLTIGIYLIPAAVAEIVAASRRDWRHLR